MTRNQEVATDYDLVVIGSGAAGTAAAHECAAAGRRVVVIDDLPFGGTCALRGCDPKKILRRNAEVIDAAGALADKGAHPGTLSADWRRAQAYKRAFTSAISTRLESDLEDAGITTVHGQASFTDPSEIEVNGRTLRGSNFLVATGAVPRPLDFPGSSHVIDSAAFLDLEELPPRILFLGGGFISFEFAHMVARAGSRATIATHGPRCLAAFDRDLVELLLTHTDSVGIDVHHDSHIRLIHPIDTGFRVVLDHDEEPLLIEADLIVHGAGRLPDLDRLNLPAANVEYGQRGVSVSEYLQSVSNPKVYAAGDAAATGAMQLTPIASLDGTTVGKNILWPYSVIPDYTAVPASVFTIPEMVRVGLLEEEARARGLDVDVRYNDTSAWYSSYRVGATVSATKVIIDRSTDRIVGAHMLGPEYSEVVNIIALSMRLGLTTAQLKSMVPTYPSVGSDLKYVI